MPAEGGVGRKGFGVRVQGFRVKEMDFGLDLWQFWIYGLSFFTGTRILQHP